MITMPAPAPVTLDPMVPNRGAQAVLVWLYIAAPTVLFLVTGLIQRFEYWQVTVVVGLLMSAVIGRMTREVQIIPGPVPVVVQRRWLWPARRITLDASARVYPVAKMERSWLTIRQGRKRADVAIEIPSTKGTLRRDPAELEFIAASITACTDGPQNAAALRQLAASYTGRPPAPVAGPLPEARRHW